MLADYENDYHFGFDIKEISEEIYKYTSGYPFLVSKLCKVIDEELGQNWTMDGVQEAAKTTIFNKNTLFTSMTRNLEEYPELKRFIYSLSILGDNITYDPNNPVIDFATMFGIIKYDANRKVSIHNIIFEEVLNNYFIAEQNIADMGKLRINYNYVTDGRLNMEFVLQRFHDLMREEYREEDGKFIERQGRLIFLSFLKPIINGTGFYYVEPQTRRRAATNCRSISPPAARTKATSSRSTSRKTRRRKSRNGSSGTGNGSSRRWCSWLLDVNVAVMVLALFHKGRGPEVC